MSPAASKTLCAASNSPCPKQALNGNSVRMACVEGILFIRADQEAVVPFAAQLRNIGHKQRLELVFSGMFDLECCGSD